MISRRPGSTAASFGFRFLGAWVAACLLVGCGDSPGLPEDTGTSLRYPIAMAASPSGELVFAVGANFDRAFRAGKVRVIDTAQDAFVPGSMEVPGYAGGIALQMPLGVTPADAVPTKVLITSRDDDGLSIADFIPASASLNCGEHDVQGHCADAHRYGQGDSDQSIGNDPMGLEVIPWGPGHWRVTVASAASGYATVLRVDQKGKFERVGQIGLSAGLYGVKTVPATGRTYVSSAGSPVLHVLRVDDDLSADSGYKVTAEPAVVLPSQAALSYARGMALSSDGARLYVADRSPTSVIEVDVTPGVSGAPRNVIVAVMPLGAQPSEVAVAPVGPGGRDWVYVSCFGDDSVWVVDPAIRQAVDIIRFPHGPYALSAVHVSAPDAQGVAQGWKLYVGLFGMHTIAAVPIDPASADRHSIAKLLTGSP